MKDNFENIEKLFQDSFEGFEADVDPNVWTNISNQIGQAPVQDPTSISTSAGSASSGVGASLGIGKIAMIVGAAAILATGSYFIFSEDKEAIKTQEDTVVQDEVKVIHQEAVEIPENQPIEVSVEQENQTSTSDQSISDQKVTEKPVSDSHSNQSLTPTTKVKSKESQPAPKISFPRGVVAAETGSVAIKKAPRMVPPPSK